MRARSKQKTEMANAIEKRRERFRCQVAKRLEEIEHNPVFVPWREFERIEKKPMVDVLSERIFAARGLNGGKLKYDKAYHFELDASYESESKLRRDNHERSVALEMVDGFCAWPFFFCMERVRRSDVVRFVHKYYRVGDYGLYEASMRVFDLAVRSGNDFEFVGIKSDLFNRLRRVAKISGYNGVSEMLTRISSCDMSKLIGGAK